VDCQGNSTVAIRSIGQSIGRREQRWKSYRFMAPWRRGKHRRVRPREPKKAIKLVMMGWFKQPRFLLIMLPLSTNKKGKEKKET
jgi:hypothetical protein